MQIEVASAPDMPLKEKGDLLERFAEEFLRTQNYKVETQVRVTAAELDLLGHGIYAPGQSRRGRAW